jgi:hypothetical protein
MVTSSLTAEDIKHISTQINSEFDLPFVPEGMEQLWIEWCIAKVLAVVPAEVVRFLADASDGLSEAEIAAYEVSITDAANAIIDVPYTPEAIEAALIRPVVNQLLAYAAKGLAITFKAE